MAAQPPVTRIVWRGVIECGRVSGAIVIRATGELASLEAKNQDEGAQQRFSRHVLIARSGRAFQATANGPPVAVRPDSLRRTPAIGLTLRANCGRKHSPICRSAAGNRTSWRLTQRPAIPQNAPLRGKGNASSSDGFAGFFQMRGVVRDGRVTNSSFVRVPSVLPGARGRMDA